MRVLFFAIIVAAMFVGCRATLDGPIGGHYALPDQELVRTFELARRGDGESCYRLHRHYSLGLQEHGEGSKWLRHAADYGYPPGMYGYGVSLWNTAEDNAQKETAKQWIGKAATAGDPHAIDFLARY